MLLEILKEYGQLHCLFFHFVVSCGVVPEDELAGAALLRELRSLYCSGMEVFDRKIFFIAVSGVMIKQVDVMELVGIRCHRAGVSEIGITAGRTA